MALVNLGCRVNRVELDLMASELQQAGAELVGEGSADAVVVNTCAVTGEAEAKARHAVRRCALLPRAPLVVACGCAASLFSAELEAIAPNVVVERDKGRVAALVLGRLGASPGHAPASPEAPAAPTPTGRTRPGIKVQDGCDNRCAYCIVWKARGPARSVPPLEVERAVLAAMARGAREVVLTGINLGSYRAEDEGGRSLGLPGLLDRLLSRTGVGRVRLSSIEPPDVTSELCSVMASAGERVAPFLHVCLQSGSDATLRRMARVYRTDLYARVVDAAREAVPRLALGTDLIVGFPGETDAEFGESLAFCERTRFARMHVFRYSRRPGTPAAAMDGQVSAPVSAQRSRRARELAARMRREEAAALAGTEDLVVVQAPGRAVSGGLFDVSVDPALPTGSLVRVRLRALRGGAALAGEALRA